MKKKNCFRTERLNIGGTTLPVPCFFPSISSIKTNLPVHEYLQVLTTLDHPLFLISAYDLHNCERKYVHKVCALLKRAIRRKIVLLDSGNYESYWKKDKKWTQHKYRNILRNAAYHLAFCFDSFQTGRGTNETVVFIEKQVLNDQRYSSGTVVPIIHSSHERFFPEIVSKVVDRLNPLLVAVPERQLGEGIIERAETIYKIRQELNSKKIYYPLHLLGTGNPLSILIYTACGADSFDGLEWCQTTVDHKTGLLYHFQQRAFFGEQTIFCEMERFPYTQATLAHNLQFYMAWMDKIQKSLRNGSLTTLMEKYIPKPALYLLKRKLPAVF